MDYNLKNKTALVTGSTAGIGLATAKLLALEGATVVINGRTDQRVNEAITKIKSTNPSAKLIPVSADLAEKAGVDKMIKQIPTVDILINNLGIYENKEFADISDDDWLRLFNINVMSGIRLSHHYLPAMLKQNWGRIIFISSESGLQIPADMIHYGMTKAAQLAVARGIAETTAGTNVTVNCVLPGTTRVESSAQLLEKAAKEHAQTVEQIEKAYLAMKRPSSLLKRFTSPEEVAALVVYLSSPISAGTNGSAMRVDGGAVQCIT